MIRIKKIQQILKSISNIAMILSERGWAEANAGNISFNISDAIGDEFDSSNLQESSKDYGFLKDISIIITSSGSRMREVATDPEKYCGVITFLSGKKGYYISAIPKASTAHLWRGFRAPGPLSIGPGSQQSLQLKRGKAGSLLYFSFFYFQSYDLKYY